MKLDEAWRSFREYMGIDDHDVPRACFYAGWISGAHAVHEAAEEACHQARTEFREGMIGELRSEQESKTPEGKPS